MARLPMIYAAAWDVAGDGHWREQYEKYADDAIDMSELQDPASERVFALLQMQVSLALLHEVERDVSRRSRLERIMAGRTKWALLDGSRDCALVLLGATEEVVSEAPLRRRVFGR